MKGGMQTVLINEHDQWIKCPEKRQEKSFTSSELQKDSILVDQIDKLRNEANLYKYENCNHFFKQFPAEETIKELSLQYPHTYHIGIFVCCREQDKYQYNFYSTLQAELAVE